MIHERLMKAKNLSKQNKIALAVAGGFLLLVLLAKKPIEKKIKQVLNDKTKADFITKILPIAKQIGNSIGVPPLFILSQLALESKWGVSTLSAKYNNFGGIKAVKGFPKVLLPTTEVINGKLQKVSREFAVFPDLQTGVNYQAKIYTNKYFKQHLNKTKDPLEYAKLLQSGAVKYATSLNYVKHIEGVLKDVKRLLTV